MKITLSENTRSEILRELPGKVESFNQFFADIFRVLEALGVEQNLCNELAVRLGHDHRPEKLLQIIRQPLPSFVAFPDGIHSNENSSIAIQRHLNFENYIACLIN